jgi:hypothetical protein
MNVTRILFFLLLGGILISSCKKNREPEPVTFSGTVTNSVDGLPVANTTIKVKVQQSADNGVFNSSFTTAVTTTTDANGNYSVTFTPESVITYKLVLEKDFYFSQEQEISGNSVSGGSNTVTNFSFDPKGWFRINFKNINPDDPNDLIIYQNTSENNGCSACCNNIPVNFEGMAVDTFLICQRVAYPNITFSWFVTKGGTTYPFTGNTTGVHGDTVIYNLNY